MEEEIAGRAYDGRLLRRLLRYMVPYWRLVAVSVVFLLLQSTLQVAGPLISKLAVDRYLAPVPARAPQFLDQYLAADPRTGLMQLAAIYALSLVVAFLCGFVEIYLMQYTGQRAMFDLRRELMQHLQRLDVSFYDRNPVGRLVTRVTTDVDALNELFASGLVAILGDILTLSFILFVMFRLSPSLTGVTLLVTPLVLATTIIFRRTVAHQYRRIRVALARINSFLQEHVAGIAVLQLFNREHKSRQQFAEINREHMLAFKDTIIAYGWFYPVVDFLAVLSMASVITYGGSQVLKGGLTLGVIIAFFQYGMRVFRPIQDLSEKYNILQSATAASERVFKLLDTPVHITPAPALRPLPDSPGRIEFDHVWFAYQGEDWVLRDVSFAIEPGETVAVVGHTGAGKTTLVSLILRFYDVNRGNIRVAGIDLRDCDPLDLRRHFGVVLQDPYLFSGTIEENIRLGTERITREDVLEAAGQVNLDGFLASLPNGIEQPIRERGSSLSTGQKQLISFARALAHGPQFLILDEATSSVDTETEMRVREALGRMVAGRTSIVIAHRLSTIQQADRILVMHKGRLRESGTHQELLALRGIYFKLYQLQYKDQEARELSPRG